MNTPTRNPGVFLGFSLALLACFFGARVHALTVTATTGENNYPAHLVTWTDSAGLQRSALMYDQSATVSPYTGYMRQYTYKVNGQDRICTGTQDNYQGGGLEYSGEGFVQNHGAYGEDVSSGNVVGFPGVNGVPAMTISPDPGTPNLSHVTITYNMPGYTYTDYTGTQETVPTTVQWFFADGRNDPIFAITQDATGTKGNLALDSRSPYGDMGYDGNAGSYVGGCSYGDQYKFVSLAPAGAGTEQLTQATGWKATDANLIPYAMQWTDPSAADAEFGHVATVPLYVSDAGEDSQTSPYVSNNLFFDPRNQSKFQSTGPMPPWAAQGYQIMNDNLNLDTLVNANGSLTLVIPYTSTPASSSNTTAAPTNTIKRLAWGCTFGRVGGFDNYDYWDGTNYFPDHTNYSRHSDDLASNSSYNLQNFLADNTAAFLPPIQSLVGTRVSGMLMSYSVFVVLGTHNGGTTNVVGSSYKTGAVGQVVSQMENAAQATLSASVGTKVTSGPPGIPSCGPATAGNTNQTVTYSPAGYNPTYASWDLNAATNAVTATLTPANGKPLQSPVFCIHGYTSPQLPGITVNIGANPVAAQYIYTTLDTVNHNLWITVNQVNQQVNAVLALTVTAPAQDPFSGASLGSGWQYSAWFGTYNNTYYPWIYDDPLGFMYVSTADNTNIYLYASDAGLGWLYTTPTSFPNIYSFQETSWLYYTPGSHSFYNYTSSQWETH